MCAAAYALLSGGACCGRRCGELHPHHDDSDRFVWRRRNTSSEEEISLAAYAYDKGVKPYVLP